jgi:hypothetical protein
MARKKKPKTVRVNNPQRRAAARKIILHCTGVIVLTTLLGVGFHFMRRNVEKVIAYPDRPPRVVMKDRPSWMSDALATQILNSVKPTELHSAFDRQLLVDTADVLRNNPWVKDVKEVRRAYGLKPADTLEIDCEFRAPIALVHWKDFYWLVDGDGVKLPEQFTQKQLASVNLQVIEGVTQPPVESGKKWPGEDLMAGLDLVKILYGRDFSDEILKIDVSNFNGRIDSQEAQLSLVTKYDTRIRWGRPLNSKDAFVEVPTAQKLQYLEQTYTQYHRVDGGKPAIDIRFDRITYSSGEASVDNSR